MIRLRLHTRCQWSSTIVVHADSSPDRASATSSASLLAPATGLTASGSISPTHDSLRAPYLLQDVSNIDNGDGASTLSQTATPSAREGFPGARARSSR